MTKRKICHFLKFCRDYTHFFRNKKPITTMYLVFLYDKYFLSYRKISYLFSAFQQTRQKTHLFCDYSKSNCRIAKPSTWLKSAFDSGKNEYNIIKIREKKIRIFCPILKFSKSILLEKILALSEKNFFLCS